MDFRNKKITVMGLGLHGGGEGLTRFLAERGAQVTVTDLKSEAELKPTLDKLSDLTNIKYHLGGHSWSDFKSADLVFINQAVSKKSLWVKKIAKAQIPISSETNLFFQMCRGQTIGVTGTNGKSTVATLIFEILKTKYQSVSILESDNQPADDNHAKVYLGGNIGGSLLKHVDQISQNDLVVLELSSFQLQDLAQIKKSPHIAVILNVTPDHLDQHSDFSEYLEAKKNIVKFQKESDFSILNYDYKNVRRIAKSSLAQNLFFSRQTELTKGSFLDEEMICVMFRGKKYQIIPTSKIKIPGVHNIENILASVLVGILYQVPVTNISRALTNFKGLPHRIELVADLAGIKFYNDSKATTPESTISALNSFQKPVILICGGKEKNLDFSKLAKTMINKVRYLLLIGETAAKIEKEIQKISQKIKQNKNQKLILPKTTLVNNLEKAVSMAKMKAKSGDVVLFSPATSSYDQFSGFEERGEKFKQFVLGAK